MTLRTLHYGNYGIFLIMGNAGFRPSTVSRVALRATIRSIRLSKCIVYECFGKQDLGCPNDEKPEAKKKTDRPHLNSKPETLKALFPELSTLEWVLAQEIGFYDPVIWALGSFQLLGF